MDLYAGFVFGVQCIRERFRQYVSWSAVFLDFAGLDGFVQEILSDVDTFASSCVAFVFAPFQLQRCCRSAVWVDARVWWFRSSSLLAIS